MSDEQTVTRFDFERPSWADIAAKDREIAALREALRLAKAALNDNLKTFDEIDAALSASPAPVSRPEYPGNIGPFVSPAPDHAEVSVDDLPARGIGKLDPRDECVSRGDYIALLNLREPDPAEAMRAKCEAIAQNHIERGITTEADERAEQIKDAIAALKGNGEGR